MKKSKRFSCTRGSILFGLKSLSRRSVRRFSFIPPYLDAVLRAEVGVGAVIAQVVADLVGIEKKKEKEQRAKRNKIKTK